MSTVVEILAWTLVGPLAALLIDRLVDRRTPERRVARLLAWYPRGWRERHGDALAELLEDAVADGRDDLRMSLDVAREGLLERARAARGRRIAAGFLTGTGWTMFFPQGVVAALLGQIDGFAPGWFLALHFGGAERWLVVGFMAGAGLLLVDRGMRLFRATACLAR